MKQGEVLQGGYLLQPLLGQLKLWLQLLHEVLVGYEHCLRKEARAITLPLPPREGCATVF